MTKASDSKQLAILQYIYDQTQAHGYPPTVREIGEALVLVLPQPFTAILRDWQKKGTSSRTPLSLAH
ncbi:hypothetical protein [Secundilactobacillus similis]|uniref:LexA family protein n=1 Tax=Secundilactobacillus similis TaxID=414682 RepID=UPI0034E1C1DC